MRRKRKPKAPWTLQQLRWRAFNAQRGLCYWCGQPMKQNCELNDPLALTADHLIPRYAGGLTKPGNIVAACRGCNNTRQVETNKPPRHEAVYKAGDDTPVSPFARLRQVGISRSNGDD
jgi:5-methylcytosine-specific restriction endonuclease McrA